jgi:hypothetical protein
MAVTGLDIDTSVTTGMVCNSRLRLGCVVLPRFAAFCHQAIQNRQYF